MYYLEGPHGCLGTIVKLVDGRTMSLGQLRGAYLSFINKIIGPTISPSYSDSQVTYDDHRIHRLIALYEDDSQLTDLKVRVEATPDHARRSAMAKVLEAKSWIREIDPYFVETFDFYIHTIFYQRSAESGGGSVSSALGVIWCSISKRWSPEDTYEFLLHELTHNILFVDERAYQHYTDLNSLSEPSLMAMSAVLELKRPLDKAFHSLVVANEVLEHRRIHGAPSSPAIHPSSDHMQKAVLRSIDSISELVDKRGDLVTDRFRDILGKCATSAHAREHNDSKVMA